MKRNKELIEQVLRMPAIDAMRHQAIDSVTATHLMVSMLSRKEQNPVDETEKEIELVQSMEDAVFYFRKYLRAKLLAYEKLFHEDHREKNAALIDAFDHGNKQLTEDDFTRE